MSSNDETKRRKEDPSIVFLDSADGSNSQRVIRFEDLIPVEAQKPLSNMALAHEIANNDNFKLEPTQYPEGSLEDKVKTEIHRAFWDLLREDLHKDPPDHAHALKLVTELKENMKSLLMDRPNLKRFEDSINEGIDLDLLKQQAEHNVIEYDKIASFVLDTLSQLCAPVRDQQIQSLKDTTDLMPKFRGIFELVELMKLDLANFAIKTVRPIIKHHSVDYEKEQFEKFLQSSQRGLRYTERWLWRAVDEWKQTKTTIDANVSDDGSVQPSSSSKVMSPSTTSYSSYDYHQIMALAFWDLLDWRDDRAFPESLLVIQARLYDMRSRIFQLIITTCATMITASTIGSVPENNSEFRTKLKNQIMPLLEDSDQSGLSHRLRKLYDQIVSLSKQSMPMECIGDEKEIALRKVIFELLQPHHPLRKIIRSRIKSFILAVVENGGQRRMDVEFPKGLSIIQRELLSLTGGFLKLTIHNRAVHSEHYDRIITTYLHSSSEHQDELSSGTANPVPPAPAETMSDSPSTLASQAIDNTASKQT